MSGDRELFRIVLRPEPGIDPVIGLRRLLKFALRACGMRCITITTAAASDALEHAHAPPVLIDGTAKRVADEIAGHDQ